MQDKKPNERQPVIFWGGLFWKKSELAEKLRIDEKGGRKKSPP